MIKHRLLLLAIAAIHSAGAAGPAGRAAEAAAAAPPRRESAIPEKPRSWRPAATAALIARGDANSLATAAALRYQAPSPASAMAMHSAPAPSAAELAARASELAPQSASIGWLHLQLCSAAPSCDIRDVATVMRWVDAENGAAWLQTLAGAQKARDTTEIDRILADMAHAARFDFYWNRIVVTMADALDGVRSGLPSGYPGSDSARLATVIGIASAEIIPPFTALVEACRDSSSAAERRELCLKLSKTMQRSDTIVAQLAGFSIEKRLVAPDGREARAIAERRRVLEWRKAQAAQLDSPLLPWTKNSRARSRLAHMRVLAREEDVCIALLRQHKMAIDPPEVHP